MGSRIVTPRVTLGRDTGFHGPVLTDSWTGDVLNDPGVVVGDRITANTTVSNTATQTTVYGLNIAPDVLETDRKLRLEVQCLVTDTEAVNLTNRTLTMRLKYGTTTIATGTLTTSDTDGATVAGIGASMGYQLHALLMADGSTQAQIGHLAISGPAAYSVRSGRLLGVFSAATTARGTGTVDSTLEKALELTVQWSFASSGCIFTVESATLELV